MCVRGGWKEGWVFLTVVLGFMTFFIVKYLFPIMIIIIDIRLYQFAIVIKTIINYNGY